MRIAVISDVHGNLPALEAVVEDLIAQAPDLVVNLGDCLSGPLWPADSARLLTALEWPCLRGNHDRYLAETPRSEMGPSDAYARDALSAKDIEWLAALPPSLEPAPGIFACHGCPGNDERYLLEDVLPDGLHTAGAESIAAKLAALPANSANLVLCGHSHIPRIARIPGRTVLNPGSVGLPAYGDDTPYGHYAEAGSPHARYAILDRNAHKGGKTALAGWNVTLRAVEYDWDKAARRAAENGRPDWQTALATGFALK